METLRKALKLLIFYDHSKNLKFQDSSHSQMSLKKKEYKIFVFLFEIFSLRYPLQTKLKQFFCETVPLTSVAPRIRIQSIRILLPDSDPDPDP